MFWNVERIGWLLAPKKSLFQPDFSQSTVPRPNSVEFRLAFERFRLKISVFMQANEANLTATDHLFRLIPWLEANLKQIALGLTVILIAVFAYFFYSYQQSQKELAAGQGLTQAMMLSDASQRAAACLKIATEYPGTLAGQRGLIEGATALFTTGKYGDAQTEFQKFLETYPDNFFTPQATLGVASCLDALGKTDQAIMAYQKAAGQTVNGNVVGTAKFSLARIYEAQGKLSEASTLFGEVARNFANTSLGSEAGMRAVELRAKLPAATAPAAATNLQFDLGK